jgi:endonuclease YncB( thermonuclease family)
MIKNQYLTFINTTKENKAIEIAYELNGKPNVAVINLKPGEVFNEGSAKIVISNKAKLISIKTPDAKGVLQDIIPSRLNTAEDILKASAVLDIETTELRAGAPITQIAVSSLEDKKSTLFIPSKQQFVATSTSLESSISFQHRLQAKGISVPAGTTFRELKYAETYMKKEGIDPGSLKTKVSLPGDKTFDQMLQASKVEKDVLEDYLIQNDKFQAKLFVEDESKLKAAGINVDPKKRILMNAVIDGSLTEQQVMDYLKANQGRLDLSNELADFSLVKDRSLRDIVNSDLPALLKDKVTWIANANFESSQFGARTRAEAERSRQAYNASVPLEKQLDSQKFNRAFFQGRMENELANLNASRSADDQLYTKAPFSGTDLTTGKPFGTTGTGTFDKARALAFKTGDFSELYEAMLEDTRPGDVRDPMDLSRALQSKLQKRGILDINKPSALSVEVQARLAFAAREMRLAEEAGKTLDPQDFIKALKTKETHIAIGDTLLSETPLVREYFDLLESLRKVEAGGKEAQELIDLAKQRKGGYYRALVVGGLQDYFNKSMTDPTKGVTLEGLDDVLYQQRIGRAMMDLAQKGEVETRQTKPGLGVKTVAVQQAGIDYYKKVNTSSFIYSNVRNISDITDMLRNVPDYKSVDKDSYIKQMLADTANFFDQDGNLIESKKADLIKYAQPKVESAADQIRVIESRLNFAVSDDYFEAVKDFAGIDSKPKKIALQMSQNVSAIPGTVPASGSSVSQVTSAAGNVKAKLNNVTAQAAGSLRKVLGRGIVGAALLGIGFKLIDEGTRDFSDKKSNYTLPDFEQFMKAQASFHGSQEAFLTKIREKYNVEGLQESGIMSEMRKMATDFGSPYRGMGYTTSVLDNFELRRERQKYEQAQFGSRHFSVDGDVGFQLKRFVDSTFRKQMGYSRRTSAMFFGDFERISAGKYNSLRGKNIIEHKVNPADISIEDADTITIRRKGSNNNPLSKFMGVNGQDSMSIRLAGIDAPETAHGDRSAQPYAEMAKQIATDLIKNAKDVRIVSRPDDTTYGRQVSMVYVDGKNLNLELVRRGAAAYLPYRGKGKSSFYNQKAFEEAEKQATEGNRGMWSDPYFRAYQMVKSRSGQSITFNTLVNASKVAKSSQLMSVASLMEEASRAGQINDALAQELIDTGESQRIAAKASKRSIYSPDSLKGNGMQADLSTFGSMGNSINSVLDQLKYEISELQRTKGSKNTAETAKTKRVSSRNMSLAKDSIESAQKEYNFEKTNRIQKIQAARMQKQKRLNDMQYMQQTALGNLFNSPINHHRM